MPSVDWEKIKAEYLAGGTSYRKLAEKYGVSKESISRCALREKWTEQREKVRDKAETKVIQKIASQRANDIAMLDSIRSALIAKLGNTVSKYPDIPGNRMEQVITETIMPDMPDDEETSRSSSKGKQKTVRFESDLWRMTTMLEKLMAMTGYNAPSGDIVEDGFIDALNAQSKEVTEDATDIPDDLHEE